MCFPQHPYWLLTLTRMRPVRRHESGRFFSLRCEPGASQIKRISQNKFSVMAATVSALAQARD